MGGFCWQFLGGPLDGDERRMPRAPQDGEVLCEGAAEYRYVWAKMRFVFAGWLVKQGEQ
jgi:hypothetical protein